MTVSAPDQHNVRSSQVRNAIVIGDDNHAQAGPHGQGEVFVALKFTVLSQYKLVFKACNTKKQFPNSIHPGHPVHRNSISQNLFLALN